MTCLQPLATPGVRACGARDEPSTVPPSRPREQLTRHDREDKVRALAAAAALVARLVSPYPSALRAVCGHVCSSAPVYVRVERSGEACREAAIRLDQRWPDCACSSRVPPYRGADAVVGAERLWSVGGPSIPPCDHSTSRWWFSPPSRIHVPSRRGVFRRPQVRDREWVGCLFGSALASALRVGEVSPAVGSSCLERSCAIREVATFESSLSAGRRSGGGVSPAVGFVLEFLHHCYGPDAGRLCYGPDLGSTVFSERDGS